MQSHMQAIRPCEARYKPRGGNITFATQFSQKAEEKQKWHITRRDNNNKNNKGG